MKIQKTFSFESEFIELLERLMKQKYCTSMTSLIIQAVTELDRKTNPAYKDVFQSKNLSTDEKVEQATKLSEAKKSKKEEKFLEIAKALEAEVYEDTGGEKRVTYYTYFENYRDIQDIPLESLSVDMVNDQYLPSKDDILRRRKEGKTNY
jgi:hypothetical protein